MNLPLLYIVAPFHPLYRRHQFVYLVFLIYCRLSARIDSGAVVVLKYLHGNSVDVLVRRRCGVVKNSADDGSNCPFLYQSSREKLSELFDLNYSCYSSC